VVEEGRVVVSYLLKDELVDLGQVECCVGFKREVHHPLELRLVFFVVERLQVWVLESIENINPCFRIEV